MTGQPAKSGSSWSASEGKVHMPVTTTTSAGGKYKHHAGTAQEVIDAIEAMGAGIVVVSMYYNGTNQSALVRIR